MGVGVATLTAATVLALGPKNKRRYETAPYTLATFASEDISARKSTATERWGPDGKYQDGAQKRLDELFAKYLKYFPDPVETKPGTWVLITPKEIETKEVVKHKL